MATIEFYGKTDCINNKKQKALLEQAGHIIIAHDILTEPWTTQRLRVFFNDMPVAEWFNRMAPAIKRGDVIPGEMTVERALAAMLKDPYLIRRPLLIIDGTYRCGLPEAELIRLCAATNDTEKKEMIRKEQLNICPQETKNTSCDTLNTERKE